MSTGTTKFPTLPLAPIQYDQKYQDQLNNILRLYFAQLDNPGPSAGSTRRVVSAVSGAEEIISGYNFSDFNTVTKTRRISLPTQVDLAGGKLRTGDLYYDTATYVVKIAP
jgi:hypothetical protein